MQAMPRAAHMLLLPYVWPACFSLPRGQVLPLASGADLGRAAGSGTTLVGPIALRCAQLREASASSYPRKAGTCATGIPCWDQAAARAQLACKPAATVHTNSHPNGTCHPAANAHAPALTTWLTPRTTPSPQPLTAPHSMPCQLHKPRHSRHTTHPASCAQRAVTTLPTPPPRPASSPG